MHSVISNIENWLQGILAILIVYKLTSYFFTKEKTLLAYTAYLVLVFIFIIPDIDNQISKYLSNKLNFAFTTGFWLIEILTIYSYFYFVYLFLNFYKDSKLRFLFNLFFRYTLPISFLVFLVDYLIYNQQYFVYYNVIFFIPIALTFALITLNKTYNSVNFIKKIYFYSFLLFCFFMLISLYYTIFPETSAMLKMGIDDSHFFMVGVFIELITISIALGIRNLVYKKASERSNERLLTQLKENQLLQEQVNTQLEQHIKRKAKKINKIVQEAEEHKLIEAENRFKIEINKLRLTSLLNQMNPHFIFNALNSIKHFVINNNAEKATYYLNKFSKLIRKMLDASTQTETILSEELKTLALYVKIENIRFNNEIEFSILNTDEIDISKYIVPSLILQPFVENCIWHGLSTKEGEKKILITISKKETDNIEISILDNGIGRKASAILKAKKRIKRQSVGLKITEERLQNFAKKYSKTCTVKYEDIEKNNKPSGTRVVLKIPMI